MRYAVPLAALAVFVSIVFAIMFFAFRGDVVCVPSGHVGRIKTSSGFGETITEQRLFRLPSNWFGMNPTTLVLAQTSENPVVEPLRVWMPQDNLNLEFELVGTFSVSRESKRVDAIYDRLKPVDVDGSTMVISFEKVYLTYGQPEVRTVGREVLAQYTIEYVLENLDAVSQLIQDRLNEKLAETPLSVRYCGLGTVKPPQLIIDAQEKAKEREIEIAQAEAQKLIELTDADTQYQVELLEQKIELVEAETQVLADVVLSDAVSDAYIAQRSLRVLQQAAANPNTRFVLSSKVFEDPASLLGLSHETIRNLDANSDARRERLERAMKLIEEGRIAAEQQTRKEAAGHGKQTVEQPVTEEPASSEAN